MTNLTENITAMAQQIGADVKALTAHIGPLANLSTTEKSNLVGVANELLSRINQVRSDLMGGVPAATLDTIKELADALQNDESTLTTLLAAVGTRVSYEPQALTLAQQGQARANIGAAALSDLGDVSHDFLADYVNAKNG